MTVSPRLAVPVIKLKKLFRFTNHSVAFVFTSLQQVDRNEPGLLKEPFAERTWTFSKILDYVKNDLCRHIVPTRVTTTFEPLPNHPTNIGSQISSHGHQIKKSFSQKKSFNFPKIAFLDTFRAAKVVRFARPLTGDTNVHYASN